MAYPNPTPEEHQLFTEELEQLGYEVVRHKHFVLHEWGNDDLSWKYRAAKEWLAINAVAPEEVPAFDVAAAIKEATEREKPWARIGAVAGVGVFILAALAFAFRMGWF